MGSRRKEDMEAKTWIPIGYRFRPTEEELIKVFLSRRVRGQPLTVNPITDCDLYGNRPPWEIFDESSICDDYNTWYCFTNLKMVSKSRVSRIAGGKGTWHGETSSKGIRDSEKNHVIIGFKKTYTFKINGKKSDWIMNEFRLADDEGSSSNQVLCKIKKLKSKAAVEEEKEEDEDEDEDEDEAMMASDEEGSSRLMSQPSSVGVPQQSDEAAVETSEQDLLKSIWDDDLPSVMNIEASVVDAWIRDLQRLIN